MNKDILLKIIFNLPKTLYFNFKALPFKQALKLPFIISNHVKLTDFKGKIILNCKPETGIIQIGFLNVAIYEHNTPGLFRIAGKVIFNGKTRLGHGVKISVGSTGELTFGKNTTITADSTIICGQKISFGDNCNVSWETLIMDTDFHNIINTENNIMNKPSSIKIGNKVWISCRCTILKDTVISNNTIVASNSLVNKKFEDENVLIGGVPAKIIRKNMQWK